MTLTFRTARQDAHLWAAILELDGSARNLRSLIGNLRREDGDEGDWLAFTMAVSNLDHHLHQVEELLEPGAP
jgi:hypothetical protein